MTTSQRIVIFLMGLLPAVATAQLTDDFSDGDFSSAPAWSGTAADFTVNAGFELQLNQTVAGTSYLSTPNTLASLNNVEWQIWVKQSFAPSSSNYGRVYIVSDQADVSGSLNGYYVQFGEAGSLDAIELFRQDGLTSTSVARGTDAAIASSFTVRIRVRRDAAGNWDLGVDATGGTSFTTQATGTDATYTTSAHFGMLCVYTASNADNFFYDDVYAGPWVFDVTPPTASSVTVISSTELDVLFSEGLDQASAETEANYSVNNGIGQPSSALLDGVDPSLVHLTFSTPFTNGQSYQISISGVQDVALNPSVLQTLPFNYVVSGTPAFREVVINEIFPDPSPQLGMPNAEFVELHNVGTQIFDLAGWKLSDGSSTATLGSYILLPGEFVVICPNADTLLFQFLTPSVLGVSSFPSLNNASDQLTLRDPAATLIDKVSYSDTWYGSATKQDGGWTLEQINPLLPCSSAANWTASVASNNGTPGAQNSVFDNTPDVAAPALVDVFAENPSLIKLVFSESQDSASVVNGAYAFTGGVSALNVSPVAPYFDTAFAVVAPLLTAGVFYTLTVSGTEDCSGNTTSSSRVFVLPETAAPGDVIINELLFDPQSGGTDFVEVYNNSAKVLDLDGWKLANWDDDTISNLKTLTGPFLLLPGEFAVISKDSDYVKREYPFAATGVYLQPDALPTYSNDSGTVYLITPLDEVSDRFAYDEDMHFPLLEETKGVTLERLSYSRETSDRDNWHSAAESQHFGTPGYQNSQFTEEMMGGDVVLTPATFSPDNDGLDDVVTLNYTMDTPGAVATVSVFDQAGRRVRVIAENELLGIEGTLSWDGITDDRTLARVGIYVVVFNWYFEDGTTGKKKLACVLAQKL